MFFLLMVIMDMENGDQVSKWGYLYSQDSRRGGGGGFQQSNKHETHQLHGIVNIPNKPTNVLRTLDNVPFRTN